MSSCPQDFDNMVSGDLTTVGERGLSLSGGQKARINLARSVKGFLFCQLVLKIDADHFQITAKIDRRLPAVL